MSERILQPLSDDQQKVADRTGGGGCGSGPMPSNRPTILMVGEEFLIFEHDDINAFGLALKNLILRGDNTPLVATRMVRGPNDELIITNGPNSVVHITPRQIMDMV